jgi:hypothetical protein
MAEAIRKQAQDEESRRVFRFIEPPLIDGAPDRTSCGAAR